MPNTIITKKMSFRAQQDDSPSELPRGVEEPAYVAAIALDTKFLDVIDAPVRPAYSNTTSIDKFGRFDCLTIETRRMGQITENITEIEVLYRQHGAALILFATAMTGERSRAQDMVHHVFLKLMENGNLSRAEDKKAYIFACVRNAVLNEQKLRDRQTPLDTEMAWFSPADRDYTGEQNLRRALGALPDDQKQVVILHVWGELTFSQIGDLLGVSSNTAASRYRYALGKLRNSMFAKENSCADSG